MDQFLRSVAALYWKDVLAEARTREVLSATLLFSLLVLVIFNFAFELRIENVATVAPGVYWVTLTFASVLALGRAFAREVDRGTLEGLLLTPVDRGALYVAKLLATLTFMIVVAAVTLPVFVGLFNLRLDWPLTIVVTLLGTFGLAAVGTLLAALAASTRAREVMLPLLLFPLAVPLLIATVRATAQALGSQEDNHPWLGLLAAYDAIFLAVSLLVFDFVIEE